VSFCDVDERIMLRDIERLIRQRLPVMGLDGLAVPESELPPAPVQRPLMPGEGRGPRRFRGARR
jgi:hypothetical protein